MNPPFQAIVMPAPAGTQYRKSRLVDANTQLPVMLPVIPELEDVRKMGREDGERFLAVFGEGVS